MDHLIKSGWRWLNEPKQWSGDTITADPDTDFWRTTHYGYVRDSAHILGVDKPGGWSLLSAVVLLRFAAKEPGGSVKAKPTRWGPGFLSEAGWRRVAS